MRISASYQKLAPGAYEGMMQIYRHVRASGLEPGLLLLVELRASQLNGCAFCMDMHATEALQGGEAPRRLHTLAGWRDAPFFSPRERAALGWTEHLTLLSGHPVDEEQYQEMLKTFTEKELVDLTFAITLINAWNRLGVAFLPDLPGAEAVR